MLFEVGQLREGSRNTAEGQVYLMQDGWRRVITRNMKCVGQCAGPGDMSPSAFYDKAGVGGCL